MFEIWDTCDILFFFFYAHDLYFASLRTTCPLGNFGENFLRMCATWQWNGIKSQSMNFSTLIEWVRFDPCPHMLSQNSKAKKTIFLLHRNGCMHYMIYEE